MQTVLFRRAARARLLAAFATLAAAAETARAGPPFYTDDPEPVEYRHNEFYLFATLDRSADGTATAGPAIEFNRGIARNTQFHIVVPFDGYSAAGGASNFGLGDGEIGVKYRFLGETADRPQIGSFPLVELSTGNAARGLGNGRTWYRLPLWIQKSWGPWTSYGGAGVDVNHAPGMQNAAFGGILLQRDLGKRLTIGGEVFRQNAQSQGGRGYTLAALGGYFNFSPAVSLLYSAGGSVAGARHTVAYVGLYWTWASRETREP